MQKFYLGNVTNQSWYKCIINQINPSLITCICNAHVFKNADPIKVRCFEYRGSTSKSENLILITLPYCTFANMISNAFILRTQFSWILLRKQKRCTGMNEDCELIDYLWHFIWEKNTTYETEEKKTPVSYYSLCTTEWKVCVTNEFN